jgi:hypothetical protein
MCYLCWFCIPNKIRFLPNTSPFFFFAQGSCGKIGKKIFPRHPSAMDTIESLKMAINIGSLVYLKSSKGLVPKKKIVFVLVLELKGDASFKSWTGTPDEASEQNMLIFGKFCLRKCSLQPS